MWGLDTLGTWGTPSYQLMPQAGTTGLGLQLPQSLGGGMPQVPGAQAGQFGFNMPTAQLGLGMLQGFGNLYGAFQANKLARDQFNFQKGMANTNMDNAIKTFNTTLEDRSRNRAFTEGRDPAEAAAYYEKNKLTR